MPLNLHHLRETWRKTVYEKNSFLEMSTVSRRSNITFHYCGKCGPVYAHRDRSLVPISGYCRLAHSEVDVERARLLFIISPHKRYLHVSNKCLSKEGGKEDYARRTLTLVSIVESLHCVST